MEILFLLAGLIIGAVIMLLIWKVKQKDSVDKKQADDLNAQINQLNNQTAQYSERCKMLTEQNDKLNEDKGIKEEKIINLSSDISKIKTENEGLLGKLENEKEEINNLQEKFTKEFENLANKILNEKGNEFTNLNKENIKSILNPLEEKIKDFEKKVNDTHISETQQRAGLKAEIEKLFELNQKMTNEATNLTRALKGDSKTQGNWGEFILESILEKSGLQKGFQYVIQQSLTNEEGSRQKPDVIVHLPEEKHIIIDSKVSLKDYELLCSSESEEGRAIHLKNHINSIRNHIKGLSLKKYQTLYDLQSLDFVIMFIPIEPAFSIAVQNEIGIWNEAFEKNIVIISPATLLATLRTIANIWKQDSQNRNAMEIAKQSGMLYDKFVGFAEDLIKVGKQIDSAKDSYKDAMNKLSDGSGNILRRVETLKKLGANASKQIPPALLDRASLEEESEKRND